MSDPIRIIVAEDQPLARYTTAFLLNTYDGLRVVGEAADGPETVELTRASTPDVVVLDYHMPRASGEYVIAQIREFSPETRVIVYSANDSQGVIDAVLQAGAAAFVSKRAKMDALLEAIRRAIQE